MKKIKGLCTIFAVIIALTACAYRNSAPNVTGNRINNQSLNEVPGQANAVRYKNGTYIGKSDPTSYGTHITRVTVQGGRISDIQLSIVDPQGKVIETEAPAPETRAVSLPRDLTISINGLKNDLIRAVIENQASTASLFSQSIASNGDMNAIGNWRVAIQRALNQASIQPE